MSKLDLDKLWKHITNLESGGTKAYSPDRIGRQLDKGGKPVKSPAGAYGFSQLKIETARRIAQQNGLEWNENKFLYDQDYNERLGRLLLDQLHAHYGDDAAKLVTGYNQGQTRVDQAIKLAEKHGGDWKEYAKGLVNTDYPTGEASAYRDIVLGNYNYEMSGGRGDQNAGLSALERARSKVLAYRAQGAAEQIDEQPDTSAHAAYSGTSDANRAALKRLMESPEQTAHDPVDLGAAAFAGTVKPEQAARPPTDLEAALITEPQGPRPSGGARAYKFEGEPAAPKPGYEPTYPGVQRNMTDVFQEYGADAFGIRNNNSYADMIVKSFESAVDNTTAMMLFRPIQNEQLRRKEAALGGSPLSADELNKRYPDMAFSGPEYPGVAELMHTEAQKRRTDASYAEMSNRLDIVSELLVGTAAFIGDPTNMAGVGVVNKALRMARVAEGVAATLKITNETKGLITHIPGLATVVASNMGFSTAARLLDAAVRKEAGDPVPAEDLPGAIGWETLIGTAAHYVTPAARKALSRAFLMGAEHARGMGLEKSARVAEFAANLASANKKAPLDAFSEDHAKRMAGFRPTYAGAGDHPSGPVYVHDSAAMPHEMPFYAAKDHTGRYVVIGDALGGVTAVSNKQSAMNVGKTVVPIVLPKSAKILSFDTPLSHPDAASIVDAARKHGVKVSAADGATLGDLIQSVRMKELSMEIPQGTLLKINKAAMDAGVSAFKDTIYFDGSPVSHVLHVLDPGAHEWGEKMTVAPDQKWSPSEEEMHAREREAMRPENDNYHDRNINQDGSEKTPAEMAKDRAPIKKFYEPTPNIAPEAYLEGHLAEKVVREMAESDPHIAEMVAEVDALFKHEKAAEEAVPKIVTEAIKTDSVAEAARAVKDALAKDGAVGSDEFVDDIARALGELKSKSRDAADFERMAQEYLSGDVVGWAEAKRIERMMHRSSVASGAARAKQNNGGSTYKNFLSVIAGGELRLNTGLNKSTTTGAAGIMAIYTARLRQVLGDAKLEILRSGMLDGHIYHELSVIQEHGLKSKPVSGSQTAREIAEGYFNVTTSLYRNRAAYSPFLGQILDYFHKQTHDREKISAVGFEEWAQFVMDRYSKKTFPDWMDAEQRLGMLRRIYTEIVTDARNSLIYDRDGMNYAERLAQKRTLIPDDHKAFLEYNKQFGKSDMGLTLFDSIRSAARDIAVMSEFGPTPGRWFRDTVALLAKHDTKFAEDYKANEKHLKEQFLAATFVPEAPAVSISLKLATGAQLLHSMAVLGNSWLSAWQDLGVVSMNYRSATGEPLPTAFVKSFMTYAKYMTQKSDVSGAFAANLGVFVDSWGKHLSAELGREAMMTPLGKAADIFHTASFMRRHQSAISAAIADIHTRLLADMMEKPFGSIDPHEKATIQRYLKRPYTEEIHGIFKKAVVVDGDGVKRLTPEGLLSLFEREYDQTLAAAGVDFNVVRELEASPGVVDKRRDSVYYKPITNYYETRNEVQWSRTEGPRVPLSSISKAYDPAGAATVATKVREYLLKSGHPEDSVNGLAAWYATVFDQIGRNLNKSPVDVFDKYHLSFERFSRREMTKNAGGPTLAYMLPVYSEGKGKVTIANLKDRYYDKSMIHESAHFFLEVLRDVNAPYAKAIEKARAGVDQNLKGKERADAIAAAEKAYHEALGPHERDFAVDLGHLFKWLDAPKLAGDVTSGGHERFANAMEVFVRASHAPAGMEQVFASFRDWYRRAIFMAKYMGQPRPVSMAFPERAPAPVETLFHRLMGGDGAVQHRESLNSLMETMPQANIGSMFAPEGLDTRARPLPTRAADLVISLGQYLNEHAEMGTTTANTRQRTAMYGHNNANTSIGAIQRVLWAFKSSSRAQMAAMLRGMLSNPAKPGGDPMRLATTVMLMSCIWVLKDTVNELLHGRTPRELDWRRAMVGGGGLGLWGDMFLRPALEADSAGDVPRTVLKSMAPTVDAVARAAGLPFVAINNARSDNPRPYANDVIRSLSDFTPGQNLFWLGGPVTDYYFKNAAKRAFAPGALDREIDAVYERGQSYIFNDPSTAHFPGGR